MNEKIENLELFRTRNSNNIATDPQKPNQPSKDSNKTESMMGKYFRNFIFRVLPLCVFISYSHLRSNDNLMSLGFLISGYFLIILEFKSEVEMPEKLDANNIKNINQELRPKNSQHILSQNSEASFSQNPSEFSPAQIQNIINIEQPLLSSQKNLNRSPFRLKKMIYFTLSIITTIEFLFKIAFVLALFADDFASQWQSENQSLIEFLNVNIQKKEATDVFEILKEFLPDFLMLLFIILLTIYIRRKKTDDCQVNENEWNLDRSAWKLRLEAFLIIGLIFTPFLCFNLLGIPYIFFTVALMICLMSDSFIKEMIKLLKIYIIFYLILNHLANVQLIMNSSAFEALDQKRKYYGIDLYVNFLKNFYNFSMNLLLLFLLLISCLYSELLIKIEKNNSMDPFLPLPPPLRKPSRSFVSFTSQEEKESQNQDPDENSLKTKCLTIFLEVYKSFLVFFRSLETILRVLQIYSIIIIMRYENIYPLGCILYVFVSSISMNHKLIIKFSGIFAIPLTTVQILILYYSNIPNNQNNLTEAKIFGFQKYELSGSEYLFLMFYLILQMTYLFQVLKVQIIKRSSLKSQNTSSNLRMSNNLKEMTFLKVFRTLLYKNSYFLVLFILFWISLYTVNLMHLILALFFVSFFLKTGTNSLIFKYSDSDENKKNMKNAVHNNKVVITFQQKYWIYLVLYVDFIILIRHIWTLFIVRYHSNLDSEYIDFLGLNYNYGFNDANLGFRDVDFANNTINWILFMFVVIQNDTYKSKIFTKAPNMMLILKDYRPFQGRIYEFLEKIIRWIYIIYYKSILWIGYLVMVSLLLFEPIDIINTMVLFILLVGLLWHLFKIQVKKVNITTVYRFWLFLTFCIVVMNVFRYVFQFFRFQLMQKAFCKTRIFDFFNQYGQIIGLFFYEPVCDDPNNCQIFSNKLRFGFIYNIILLFFAVLGYNFLALVQLYEKSSMKSLENNEENPNNQSDLEVGNDKRFSFESESIREVGFSDVIKKIRIFFEDYVNVSLRKEM